MWIIKFKPTVKTKQWLKENKLDCNALSNAITAVFSDIHRSKKYKQVTLTLQVDGDSSGYCFGTNKIFLCKTPNLTKVSLKQTKFLILLHLLHEFRHWMQSQIFNIKDSELKYTQEDVDFNRKSYWCNKHEKDARKFERKYVKKFMRYYMCFKNTGQ